ncbi:Nn.00g090370.m01.CDS01 [Neocucurbitaria sp. VM-36]
MSGYQKKNRNQSEDSISDQACTRCRDRKIRCGRELPQCNNCERDDSVTCLYQNPTKRVNHLKSLFDSVDGVKERLINIESHLSRLAVSIEQNMDHNNSCAASSTLQASVAGNLYVEDVEDRPASPGPYSDECTDLHVFRNRVDMVDYYHGPLSLFTLCKQFQSYAPSIRNAESGASLGDMLQNLCDRAGVVEPFPPFGGQSVVSLLPKHQVITVIGHFLQHADCATDIFVKSNLLAHVERIYSRPTEPGDDVWAICFQAITVLVWGMEISAQGGNGLFGDFAHLFLPSRAALVNSRLLTTPKLVNIQTLILLSIAAQQFDPPGWAELIFANACGLARTMGLHHAQLFPHETSTYENIERAKVVQSLYVRDKSLCTTRGSVSWLPTHDCNIGSQLSTAIELQAPYHDILQRAMIQDEIYRLTHAASFRTSGTSKSQTAKELRYIEHQLVRYTQTFGLFNCEASSYNSRLALLTMEFLNTRILALQLGSEQRHAEQLRSDARASCLLLLIAHGVQDREVLDEYDTLTCQNTTGHQDETSSTIKASTGSFASVLDAFSLPAFFILLKDGLLSSENDDRSNADLELLRRVCTCYIDSTEPMQSNSYHRRVAWTFEQLLTISDLIKNPEYHHDEFVAPTPLSQLILSLSTQTNNHSTFSRASSIGGEPSFSFLSQPTASTPFPWYTAASNPSSLELYTPFSSANSADASETGISNVPDQLRQGGSNSSPERSMSWHEITPESHTTRKRLRTDEES